MIQAEGNMRRPLVEARKLKKSFRIDAKHVLSAVDGVSFLIRKGETMGLVGESGCGKTTCGRTILRLYEPTAGQVLFDGKDVAAAKTWRQQLAFKKDAQMIFQDPYSALDPRMTIRESIAEGLIVHSKYTAAERRDVVHQLLGSIGLTRDFGNRFPHELSGGQCQRVGIARALSVNPRFIICDEPISALDVSIQAQIVNLLMALQEKMDLTYLFISHDLSMVKHISDNVGVMYLGVLVEMAESNELFEHAAHPYTQALISAILTADPDFEALRKRTKLAGEVPSPLDPPSGCRFRTRCPRADKLCEKETPELTEQSAGHFVACHHC